jgi:hypothetical protein
VITGSNPVGRANTLQMGRTHCGAMSSPLVAQRAKTTFETHADFPREQVQY